MQAAGLKRSLCRAAKAACKKHRGFYLGSIGEPPAAPEQGLRGEGNCRKAAAAHLVLPWHVSWTRKNACVPPLPLASGLAAILAQD
jgi:hypothetical protein